MEVRVTERGGDTQIEILHLLAHSLEGYNGHGSVRSKTRSGASEASTRVAETQVLGPSCFAFPKPVTEYWIETGASTT